MAIVLHEHKLVFIDFPFSSSAYVRDTLKGIGEVEVIGDKIPPDLMGRFAYDNPDYRYFGVSRDALSWYQLAWLNLGSVPRPDQAWHPIWAIEHLRTETFEGFIRNILAHEPAYFSRLSARFFMPEWVKGNPPVAILDYNHLPDQLRNLLQWIKVPAGKVVSAMDGRTYSPNKVSLPLDAQLRDTLLASEAWNYITITPETWKNNPKF